METKMGDLDGLGKASTEAIKREEKESVATPPGNPLVENVPDPDEDDLDDLDDMLDEFSPAKTDANEQTPKASGPGRPPVIDAPKDLFGVEGMTDDDFAKQLQAGMADLLGELQTNPEMQSQFENMLKEIGGATALEEAAGGLPSGVTSGQPNSGPSSKAGLSAGGDESFQETIKKTMERMQASGEQATAAAAAEDTDDILAELMKQMQAGAGLGGGEDSEEDFSKMLLGMMEQLTNKEILYEPMKELDDKFPEWMEKNKPTTLKEDMKRYEEQRTVVREIVAKFEEKTYADSNIADREYIVERMQKMQAAGSPPPDLVGDMASAQEAFGAPEEGCPQQ